MSYVAKRTEGGQTLAFTFHGTGGDETQFHEFAEQVLPGSSVVSPRGDVSEMGALRYFRRTGEGVYDMADLARRTEAMAAFLKAEKARVSATRTVGVGYSNGANILSAVAFRHPDLVDELVLLHPLIPFEPAAQPGLMGRRVLITAGQRDPICPPALTDRLAKWFEAQGAEVTLDWHAGGHEIAQSEVTAIQRFLSPDAA
jgi:phospholipase/carboxylesterase